MTKKIGANKESAVWCRNRNNVQRNIGKFSQYFRQNFVVVDNNDELENDGIVLNSVFKQIKPLANKKPTSKLAMAWIANELKMKKR